MKTHNQELLESVLSGKRTLLLMYELALKEYFTTAWWRVLQKARLQGVYQTIYIFLEQVNQAEKELQIKIETENKLN